MNSPSLTRSSPWPCHPWPSRHLCAHCQVGVTAPCQHHLAQPRPPVGSTQPAALSLSSIVCAAKTGTLGGSRLWAAVSGPCSSCRGLICMQKGLVGIYCGLIPGSCSRPRNTLRRQHAVGKIRTGPSATTHALVTLQATSIEIIFIYNLFDHPASKRARLVCQRAPKWPNYSKRREQLKTVRCERRGAWSGSRLFPCLLPPIFLQLLTYIELHVPGLDPRGTVSKICSPQSGLFRSK